MPAASRKIRPIATHRLFIHDYCRGADCLCSLALRPTPRTAMATSSARRMAAVPSGSGRSMTSGHSASQSAAADLGRQRQFMRGRAVRPLPDGRIRSEAPDPVAPTRHSLRVELQIDITGTGLWQSYRTIDVPSGQPMGYDFPDGMSAYWIRFVASADAVVTSELCYE